MYTAMVIMLIVIFGAALMGKMLKDMFPGSISTMFKKNKEETPAAE